MQLLLLLLRDPPKRPRGCRVPAIGHNKKWSCPRRSFKYTSLSVARFIADHFYGSAQWSADTNDTVHNPRRTSASSKVRCDISIAGPPNARVVNRGTKSGRALDGSGSGSSFFSTNDESSAYFSDEMDEDQQVRQAYLQQRASEEQALLQKAADAKVALEQLEAEWLAAPDNVPPEQKKKFKAQRWKLARNIDDCNRSVERFQSSVQIGEFAAKVSVFENEVTDVKSRQSSLETRQSNLELTVAEERQQRRNLEDKVAQLAAQQAILFQEQGAMRKTVDLIDNRVRLQSIVFHGIDTSDPYAALAAFLPAEAMDAIDTINEIGVQNEQGVRTSILVRFVTIRDCQRVEDYLRSDEFRESPHAGTSWHHDSSELLRVGKTRMNAVGDALQAKFPGIELRATFVRYPPESGIKHFAQEFANSHIIINDTPFHIDAAVAANPDYVSNPAAKVTIGGRTYNSLRLKNRGAARSRGRGRGRGGGQPPRFGRPPATGHGRVVNDAAGRDVAPPPAENRREASHARDNVGPTRTGNNLTNQLPPLNEPSTHNVQLFANAGNYGSSRTSNKMGTIPDRYAGHSSRFSPYHR